MPRERIVLPPVAGAGIRWDPPMRMPALSAPVAPPIAIPCLPEGIVRPGTRAGAAATPMASDREDGGDAGGGRGAPGQHLLGGDQHGDHDHPGQAHRAQREQRRHQRPAAPRHQRAVHDAHAQRAGAAVAPFGHEEAQRPAAALQAGVLQRCELIDRRRRQHGGGGPAAGVVPGEEAPVERSPQLQQRVADQSRRAPESR